MSDCRGHNLPLAFVSCTATCHAAFILSAMAALPGRALAGPCIWQCAQVCDSRAVSSSSQYTQRAASDVAVRRLVSPFAVSTSLPHMQELCSLRLRRSCISGISATIRGTTFDSRHQSTATSRSTAIQNAVMNPSLLTYALFDSIAVTPRFAHQGQGINQMEYSLN